MATSVPPSQALPPAVRRISLATWLHKNLFSTWYNILITIVLVGLLARTVIGFVNWAITTAQWRVIPANLNLFFVGLFPLNQYWRLWVIVSVMALMSGLSWGILARKTPQLFPRAVSISAGILAIIILSIPTPMPYRLGFVAIEGLILIAAWMGRQAGRRFSHLGQWLSLGWALSFFVMFWFLIGGLGLPLVETTKWGGLLLSMFLAIISSIISFPIGILLALGRQSDLPVFRWVSTFFIEVIRGTPLTALLFVGAVMVPLFLPGNARPDLIFRTMVGLTLFCSAYLAETVRGGLQAISRGQTEAARALGLSTPLTLGLIILPQALKISIPALVGLFIDMVQETTLVSIVGLFDLLGISRSILANQQFIGRYAEVYLFIGFLYWLMCYSMSIGSRKIEEHFNRG
jgi:general L-amino acid transport system permease protein